MTRTLKKSFRDLAVLIIATAAWWLTEHVGELGLPQELSPLVGAIALAIYRVARDKTQGQPK